MSDAIKEFNEVLRTQKTISISRLIKLRRGMGVVNSRRVEELEEENKKYREGLLKLHEDISRNGKYGEFISKQTAHNISRDIEDLYRKDV